MESQLFCYFSWWCATRNIERVYQESRKAVLEGRGLCPVFSVRDDSASNGKQDQGKNRTSKVIPEKRILFEQLSLQLFD
ncbi:hypothetical protein A2T80_014120 [Aphanizomenon flos-aquae UKL13-PB]|jgi:hypothetical protein|nr:hypothetical protein [Aphanizomenon flos-aquae UKL13-PB]